MKPRKMKTKRSRPNPVSDLRGLFRRRVREVEAAVGFRLPLTADTGPYHYFNSPRGFGVTFTYEKGDRCHVRLADKLSNEPIDRQDGIIRHELGHVVDQVTNPASLDKWAKERGVILPPRSQGEIRADAIALAIWRESLLYDEDTVQSTRNGSLIRPRHLGW